MTDQQEWHDAIAEAAEFQKPPAIRRLFSSILLYCAVLDPKDLWEKQKEHCYEARPDWSDERKEAQALYHIGKTLEYHGTSLSRLNLPGFFLKKVTIKPKF